MAAQLKLNLNWNGFEANLRDTLKSMREEAEFSDVTLVADDGNEVKASKVILSQGSSFFHRILRDNPHMYSHIYLVDVPYKHLLSVMDFLYTGDAVIRQGDIKQFLEVAEDSFRIKIEGAGVISPDQPIPKTVTTLQNQIFLEDHTQEKRKPYPPKTISAPFKGDIAVEVQVTQNSGYFSQTQLSAEKQAQKIDGNYHSNALHQEQLAAEKHAQTIDGNDHPNAHHQEKQAAKKRAQKMGWYPNAHYQGKRASEKQVQNKIYHTNASHQSQDLVFDFFERQLAKKPRFHPNAQHQPQVVAGGEATRKNISSNQYQAPSNEHAQTKTMSPSTEATPVLQGRVSADVRTTSQPAQQFLRNVSPPLSNNTFPNPKHQDDTDIVKGEVPVGDANDFNVHYVSNDLGEQYISEMTHLERVFRNNASNYQDVRGQNLAMDQDENRKIPKEEPIDTSDNCDIVHSIAVDREAGSEETIHVMYDGDEENGYKIPVEVKQNHKIKNCSVKLLNMKRGLREEACRQSRRQAKRKNMDQSECENTVTKTLNKVSTQDNSEPVEDMEGDEMREEVGLDSDNEEENGFQCPFCGKLCRCASQLIAHKRIHTGEKPFKCVLCSKRFARQHCLTTHIRIHTGEKPFKCSICSKRFCQQSQLTSHKRIHTGEKPYQCKQCPKSFSRLGSLHSHMRSHTGEKPYQCLHCTKSFSMSSNLYAHMRIHSGEKPFKCTFCSKRFCHQSTMIVHKRIHTGEKPYKCVICAKNFRSSSLLARHKRKECSS